MFFCDNNSLVEPDISELRSCLLTVINYSQRAGYHSNEAADQMDSRPLVILQLRRGGFDIDDAFRKPQRLPIAVMAGVMFVRRRVVVQSSSSTLDQLIERRQGIVYRWNAAKCGYHLTRWTTPMHGECHAVFVLGGNAKGDIGMTDEMQSMEDCKIERVA